MLTRLFCVYQAVLIALELAPTHGTIIIRSRSKKCVEDLTMWRQAGWVAESEDERSWIRDNRPILDGIWRELLRIERVVFCYTASGTSATAWRAEQSVAPQQRVESRLEAHVPFPPTADSL